MILLVPTIVFAATATVVYDRTSPSCFVNLDDDKPSPNCHSLFVEAGVGESVIYTIDADLVETDTQYSVSFMYKLKSKTGKLEFILPDLVLPVAEESRGKVNDRTWTLFTTTFTTPDDIRADGFRLEFKAVGGNVDFYLDDIQMTRSPEPTKFNNFRYEAGCCPFDYCWTGGAIAAHPSCIHDDYYEYNVSMPPIGFELADFSGISSLDTPNGYRCINGTWNFQRAKFTPLFDSAGFCPLPSQCFIGTENNGHPPSEPWKAVDPEYACVENNTVSPYKGEDENILEYHYCYNGNWTTRTKEIAIQLLTMAQDSGSKEYTIFCDRYDRSLNSDELMSLYRDYIGENVAMLLSSAQINEFCIMDLNGQVIAGVSLNNVSINKTIQSGDCGSTLGSMMYPELYDADTGCPLSNEQPPSKSFIQLLKGLDNNDYCDSAMDEEDDFNGLYHQCKNEDVYYNAHLRSVIFAKPTPDRRSVPLKVEETTYIWDLVFDYLKQVITRLLGITGLVNPQLEIAQHSEMGFIEKAGSFDKLYINHHDEGPNDNVRQIKAIRETRAYRIQGNPQIQYATFISAQYLNYQAPICRRYFYKHVPDAGDILRRQISHYTTDLIQCTPVIMGDDQWMHSIYVEDPAFENIPGTETSPPFVAAADDLTSVRVWKGGSDTFWNDITAKVRTQHPTHIPNDAVAPRPAEPDFVSDPEIPVAGAVTEFNITSPGADSKELIARTWSFDDGQNASSAFNITTKHMFEAEKDYNVKLCVMNTNYKTRCAERTITVIAGPSVEIDEEDPQDYEISVDFTITGGNPTYNFEIDWDAGDGEDEEDSIDEESNFGGGIFESDHEYEDPGQYLINISGTDGTGDEGLPFANTKVIYIPEIP
jgi:hypothetical protein